MTDYHKVTELERRITKLERQAAINAILIFVLSVLGLFSHVLQG